MPDRHKCIGDRLHEAGRAAHVDERTLRGRPSGLGEEIGADSACTAVQFGGCSRVNVIVVA